jgi:hypothetical protein
LSGDLPPGDRQSVFERQLEYRALARAVDPAAPSPTVRAVLERLGIRPRQEE